MQICFYLCLSWHCTERHCIDFQCETAVHWAEWIPFYFSMGAPERKETQAAPGPPGVGWSAICTGVAGMLFHLNSHFFTDSSTHWNGCPFSQVPSLLSGGYLSPAFSFPHAVASLPRACTSCGVSMTFWMSASLNVFS